MLSHNKVRLALQAGSRVVATPACSAEHVCTYQKLTNQLFHINILRKAFFSSKVFVSILKKLIVLVLQCIIMLSNHGVSWFLNMVESFSLKYRNISKKHEVTRCRNLGCWAGSAPTWTKPKSNFYSEFSLYVSGVF